MLLDIASIILYKNIIPNNIDIITLYNIDIISFIYNILRINESKKDLKIIIPKVDIDSLYNLFFLF